MVLLAVPFFGGQPAAGTDPVSREYQLKAAFLYNFTKFIVWPTQRSGQPDTPLVIGVLGRNPFGNELEKIVRGRTTSGREIRVRFLNTSADAHSLDVLFVPAGEEKRVVGQLDGLHASAVLTVGETSQFMALGGIITFSMEADKIRFEISRQSGQRAGLKISPHLLKLSTSVRKGLP